MGRTPEQIQSDLSGQAPMTAEEVEAIGRAVSKGYAYPYDAWRLGVLEGARAALKRAASDG